MSSLRTTVSAGPLLALLLFLGACGSEPTLEVDTGISREEGGGSEGDATTTVGDVEIVPTHGDAGEEPAGEASNANSGNGGQTTTVPGEEGGQAATGGGGESEAPTEAWQQHRLAAMVPAEADLLEGWQVDEVLVRDEPDVVDVDFDSDVARQCGVDERAALPPGLEVTFDGPEAQGTFLALGDGAPEDISAAFEAVSVVFTCAGLTEEDGFSTTSSASPDVAGAEQVVSYTLQDNETDEINEMLMVDFGGLLVLFVQPGSSQDATIDGPTFVAELASRR